MKFFFALTKFDIVNFYKNVREYKAARQHYYWIYGTRSIPSRSNIRENRDKDREGFEKKNEQSKLENNKRMMRRNNFTDQWKTVNRERETLALFLSILSLPFFTLFFLSFYSFSFPFFTLFLSIYSLSFIVYSLSPFFTLFISLFLLFFFLLFYSFSFSLFLLFSFSLSFSLLFSFTLFLSLSLLLSFTLLHSRCLFYFASSFFVFGFPLIRESERKKRETEKEKMRERD